MSLFSERAKEIRAERGYSMMKLAVLSGVTPPTIFNVEAGRVSNPTFILELAAALEVDPYWLAGKEHLINGEEDK